MDSIKKLLGAKIGRMRKAKGFSQMKFAELLGISTNALSLIETGNGFCTAETLGKILKHLDLKPEELFSFGGLAEDEDIYNSILRKLELLKNDREKLNAVDLFLNNIL